MTKKKILIETNKNDSSLINQQFRPPVVVVLGHIDHGKTSLLDKIRETDVAAGETGGITQHIGAYQVRMEGRENAKIETITFIDTPGHAAFSKMRSCGAKVADLVVLVIAADEGFRPQTQECLDHIRAAKIPFLVAINKIDLPHLDLKKLKENLAQNGVAVEDEGGEIVAIPVSAKTGEGIKDLLEMILLLAEMAELKGSLNDDLEAVVIESKFEQNRGVMATILVRNGCLKVGDEIQVEKVKAKVKAIFDEHGQKITAAGLSKPVEVLGFKEVPPVGGKVIRVSEAGEPLKTEDGFLGDKPPETIALSPEESKNKLNLILKADASGTLEAILKSLPEGVAVILSGVGDLSESDILLADTVKAQVVGFRVRAANGIKKLAETEKVTINLYQTIYELLEEIEEKVLKLMEPTIDEEILGKAEVIAEFEIKKQKIAGCQVSEGRITKRDRLHLKRAEENIGNCQIKSMKKGKEEISLAQKSEEFGVILSPPLDFKVGDVLVSYRPAQDGN